ncbi:MAG: class I SAM-dependent methyltransferase [Acidimicrobiia bacterium]
MEIANVEMAKAWDGEEGDDWTEHAEQYEAGGRYAWPAFISKVSFAPSDALLDIGCGTGKSTRELARTVERATGVDLSARMLEYARKRSTEAGLTNVEFVQADAQVHPFPTATYDIAISNYGAMFFENPVAAFTNIRGALRPGGRLALLTWQPSDRQAWLQVIFAALTAGRDLSPPPPGVPGPFGLAEPDRVHAILEGAGFSDVDLAALNAPMWLGATADDAWNFVSSMGPVRGLSRGLDGDTKRACLERLREDVAAHETPDGVQFDAGQWLITAHA